MSLPIHTFRTDDAELPYIDTGGDKPTLHFSHANGIPVVAYEPLIHELARDWRVLGLGHRGQLGGVGEIRTWRSLSHDLEAFLEEKAVKPVYGVGHSIGAVVSMFAAARRPDMFSSLVMIDPVLLSPRIVMMIRLARLFGVKARSPLSKRARGRRNGWGSKEEAFEFFKGKGMFHGWREDFLRAYVDNGLFQAPFGDGFVLLCPPEVEAQGFENYSPDVWSWPARIKIPTLIVQGERSDVLSKECFEKFQKLCPGSAGIVLPDCNHFVPMQKTDETLKIIRDFSPLS